MACSDKIRNQAKFGADHHRVDALQDLRRERPQVVLDGLHPQRSSSAKSLWPSIWRMVKWLCKDLFADLRLHVDVLQAARKRGMSSRERGSN